MQKMEDEMEKWSSMACCPLGADLVLAAGVMVVRWSPCGGRLSSLAARSRRYLPLWVAGKEDINLFTSLNLPQNLKNNKFKPKLSNPNLQHKPFISTLYFIKPIVLKNPSFQAGIFACNRNCQYSNPKLAFLLQAAVKMNILQWVVSEKACTIFPDRNLACNRNAQYSDPTPLQAAVKMNIMGRMLAVMACCLIPAKYFDESNFPVLIVLEHLSISIKFYYDHHLFELAVLIDYYTLCAMNWFYFSLDCKHYISSHLFLIVYSSFILALLRSNLLDERYQYPEFIHHLLQKNISQIRIVDPNFSFCYWGYNYDLIKSDWSGEEQHKVQIFLLNNPQLFCFENNFMVLSSMLMNGCYNLMNIYDSWVEGSPYFSFGGFQSQDHHVDKATNALNCLCYMLHIYSCYFVPHLLLSHKLWDISKLTKCRHSMKKTRRFQTEEASITIPYSYTKNFKLYPTDPLGYHVVVSCSKLTNKPLENKPTIKLSVTKIICTTGSENRLLVMQGYHSIDQISKPGEGNNMKG